MVVLACSAITNLATHLLMATLEESQSRGGRHAQRERRRLGSEAGEAGEAGRAHDKATLGHQWGVCVKGTDVQTIAQEVCSEKFLQGPAREAVPANERRARAEDFGGETRPPSTTSNDSRAFRNGGGSPPASFLPFVLWPMPAVFGVLAHARRPFGRRWTRVTSSRHAPPQRPCG